MSTEEQKLPTLSEQIESNPSKEGGTTDNKPKKDLSLRDKL